MTQHESFLNRIASHDKLGHDHDLRIFLTYKGDLEVRGENAQEKESEILMLDIKKNIIKIENLFKKKQKIKQSQ